MRIRIRNTGLVLPGPERRTGRSRRRRRPQNNLNVAFLEEDMLKS